MGTGEDAYQEIAASSVTISGERIAHEDAVLAQHGAEGLRKLSCIEVLALSFCADGGMKQGYAEIVYAQFGVEGKNLDAKVGGDV
jgi:hypothetical protein